MPEDLELASRPEGSSPHHGFRGAPAVQGRPDLPAGLSIAISREAGARGATIARRVGAKLGWQVFSQELLEYMAQEGPLRQEMLEQLTPQAQAWIDEQMNRLLREQNLSRHPSILELARMVLSVAVQGEVILLGRGAGCILPASSTLHVRLIAPLADRIAYMAQWQRLTEEEAADLVRKRDNLRAEFLNTHFHRKPADVHQYDLVLNTSLLGEDRCTELVILAAKGKHKATNDE